MSIETENPETLLEKVDALTNWVEQMKISHDLGDKLYFIKAYNHASELGFEILQLLEEQSAE